jgi:HEAT repeat protein
LAETADENARELLILVALQVGLEKKIRFHLNRAEPVRQRILLLSVIGALKDPAFQEICFQYLTAENSFLSLAAARALLQINPQGNIAPVVEMLARRHDWPTSRTSLALLEAGIDVISQPLAELLWKTPTQDLPYLIPYLDITSSETAIPTLQTILANTSDEQVILACLRGLARSSRYQYTDIIGLFLSHTNPHIRAEAVHTMSHIGAFTDGLLILPLLEDNIPLVQYRAAQALINLPGMTQTKARQLQQLLKNPSAVTTLTRVIDEKRFKR